MAHNFLAAVRHIRSRSENVNPAAARKAKENDEKEEAVEEEEEEEREQQKRTAQPHHSDWPARTNGPREAVAEPPKKKRKGNNKKKPKSIFSSERRTKASPVYGGRRIPRRIAASNENILEQAKWRSEIVMESPMEDDWWPMGWVVVVGVVVVGFSR